MRQDIASEPQLMGVTEVAPEETSPEVHPGLLARMILAADVNDVMREQLDFLIEHAGSGSCGCRQCHRYLSARAVLMEIFSKH